MSLFFTRDFALVNEKLCATIGHCQSSQGYIGSQLILERLKEKTSHFVVTKSMSRNEDGEEDQKPRAREQPSELAEDLESTASNEQTTLPHYAYSSANLARLPQSSGVAQLVAAQPRAIPVVFPTIQPENEPRMNPNSRIGRAFQQAVVDERERLEKKAREERAQELLARQLQQSLEQEEIFERKRLRERAKRAMESSPTGKAWRFVERVYSLFRSHPQLHGEEPVGLNDMVFLAEHMFEAQMEFRRQRLPCTVDIGYHYTRKNNIARIRTDGLLSKAEREAKSVESNFNGETYGPGIYTGNDAQTFQNYGTIGLVVARLKGKEMDAREAKCGYAKGNTCIISGPIVVLQRSSQCLALVQFQRRHAVAVVAAYRADLYEIIDEFFNGAGFAPSPLARASGQSLSAASGMAVAGKAFLVPPTPHVATNNDARMRQPSAGSKNASGSDTRNPLRGYSRSTVVARSFETLEDLHYEAPVSLSSIQSRMHKPVAFSGSGRSCILCRQSLLSSHCVVVAPFECLHVCHRQCIEGLQQNPTMCPYCSAGLKKQPLGKMPSGTMRVSLHRTMKCAGFSVGTYVIHYTIPSGIQRPYHIKPGSRHGPAECYAYLPDNESGRKLLLRLRYAFMHGLTFDLGASIKTGRSNSVVWASIPHKTSTSGGPHGFPDLNYFPDCNGALDSLGVPRDCPL